MGRRTIYVKDEDDALFEQLAQERKLSQVISDAVRKYYQEETEETSVPDGMETIRLWVDHRQIQFIGKEIWPPTNDELEECQDQTLDWAARSYWKLVDEEPIVYKFFVTRKKKILEYYIDQFDRTADYKVFDDVPSLLAHWKIEEGSSLASCIASRAGTPFIEVLDI